LTTIAVILSLIFAFLIFTQIEMIRLYIDRWRLLEQLLVSTPPESLDPSKEGDEIHEPFERSRRKHCEVVQDVGAHD
jgi:hypothetical protein